MRTMIVLVLMLAGTVVHAGAPQRSTLEDWKSFRGVDHADTLVVEAPFDSTSKATARALASLGYEIVENGRTSGHFSTAWWDVTESPGDHGAEWIFIDHESPSAIPSYDFSSPECPGCWFTSIHCRTVADLEPLAPTRTRVVASTQFVGFARGHTDPLALVSRGAFERALLKRIDSMLSQ